MTTNFDNPIPVEQITIKANEYEVACEFHKIFKDMYKTTITKIRTVTWFVYKNEKWEKEAKNIIFNKIRLDLTNLFEQKLTAHNMITLTDNNIYTNTIIKQNLERILKIAKTDNYIKNIMKELIEMFL
jgi:hypothetical protein